MGKVIQIMGEGLEKDPLFREEVQPLVVTDFNTA